MAASFPGSSLPACHPKLSCPSVQAGLGLCQSQLGGPQPRVTHGLLRGLGGLSREGANTSFLQLTPPIAGGAWDSVGQAGWVGRSAEWKFNGMSTETPHTAVLGQGPLPTASRRAAVSLPSPQGTAVPCTSQAARWTVSSAHLPGGQTLYPHRAKASPGSGGGGHLLPAALTPTHGGYTRRGPCARGPGSCHTQARGKGEGSVGQRGPDLLADIRHNVVVAVGLGAAPSKCWCPGLARLSVLRRRCGVCWPARGLQCKRVGRGLGGSAGPCQTRGGWGWGSPGGAHGRSQGTVTATRAQKAQSWCRGWGAEG